MLAGLCGLGHCQVGPCGTGSSTEGAGYIMTYIYFISSALWVLPLTMAEFIPNLPSYIDQWLNVVSKKPGTSSLWEDCVVCWVERVCIEVSLPSLTWQYRQGLLSTMKAHDNRTDSSNSPTYILYISAQRMDEPFFLGRALGLFWVTLWASHMNNIPLNGCSIQSHLSHLHREWPPLRNFLDKWHPGKSTLIRSVNPFFNIRQLSLYYSQVCH